MIMRPPGLESSCSAAHSFTSRQGAARVHVEVRIDVVSCQRLERSVHSVRVIGNQDVDVAERRHGRANHTCRSLAVAEICFLVLHPSARLVQLLEHRFHSSKVDTPWPRRVEWCPRLNK
jgi:hypothetical protein